MTTKSAPHNIDAEKSILGAILLDPTSFHKLTRIQVSDFYIDAHRRIYRALQQLITAGISPDIVTVSDQLRKNGDFEKSGGKDLLCELVDYTPTAENIRYYANIVTENSVKRQVIAAGKAIQAAAAESSDMNQLISEAFGLLQAIGQENNAEKIWLTTGDMAADYQQFIASKAEQCFQTGYPELDVLLGGVAPGEVMMIMGFSGTFKSAFMQNILMNSAKKTGKKSLFYSMEMPANLVYQRTVQIGLEQATYYIESGYAGTKPGYQEQTLSELDRLGYANMLICQKPALTIEQVEHYARVARAEHGNIGVIGIDYLGLMSATGAKSEYERISYCAEQSKNLAKRLKLPVVILTQINRASARDGKVDMTSAKGSGATEASADYMLSLVRNEQKDIIIDLLKNRSGDANYKFIAQVELKHLKFRSLEPYNEICAKNVERNKNRKARELRNSAVFDCEPY